VDPLAGKYAYYTPYQYAGNKPINKIDIDGLEEENATPSPGSQKTASVATSGSPPIDSSGISGTIYLRAAEVIDQAPEKSFWQKAGGFVREHIIDNIPVVGGLVKAVEAIIEGDWKGAAMGFGEALLDGVLLVTTGGIGNIAKVAAKTATKIIAKETLENYVSGKVSDGLSDVGISPLGQVALGVVLGIRPGKGKKPTFDADATKGVTRSLDDLTSLRGATWKEAESLIPKGWTRGPLNKGEGIKFVNPAKKGEQILLEKGWQGAKDPLHSGPYIKISRDGQVTRIPLQGNPTLK